MLKIISIDYVPGVCDSILPYFQREQDILVLPTHTDILRHTDTPTATISNCLQNIIHRLRHIDRCTDSKKTIVCTHWFDVPFRFLGTDLEDVIVSYVERHTRDLIKAFNMEYRHIPVVLNVHTDECLERLITNMDGKELGTYKITQYRSHLLKIPRTYRIDIPTDGLDIRYICERIVESVISIRDGL